MVTLKTNFGDIKLELFADKAPKTVANFLAYVEHWEYLYFCHISQPHHHNRQNHYSS